MIAYSALGPLQTAIYAVLTADAPFMTLAGAVYDDVPEGSAFPYVTFGDATETAWDTFGQNGSDTTFSMHIWSRYRGYAEAQRIVNALVGLLDNRTGLVIDGYGTVALNVESTQQLRDPDGITRHLVTRFRVFADAS